MGGTRGNGGLFNKSLTRTGQEQKKEALVER